MGVSKPSSPFAAGRGLRWLFLSSLWPALKRAGLVSGEAFERGCDQARKRAQVVAAFEHGCAARRERGASARQLAEPVVADVHPGERVLGVRIEPGRDEHQVGLER